MEMWRRYYTSQYQYKLRNIEIVYYIIWLGKSIDVQKSHFQVMKMLKMNIMKQSTKKYRADDSFIFFE